MSSKKSNHDMHPICQRLKQMIGKSVPEISDKLKLTDQTVRKWINGSIPGADKIADICSAAGISIVWLLTGVGEEDPPIDIVTRDLLQKAKRVLMNKESASSSALASNIYAFDAALKFENENKLLRIEIDALKKPGTGKLTIVPPIPTKTDDVINGAC